VALGERATGSGLEVAFGDAGPVFVREADGDEDPPRSVLGGGGDGAPVVVDEAVLEVASAADVVAVGVVAAAEDVDETGRAT
jgi:hypothetical protein